MNTLQSVYKEDRRQPRRGWASGRYLNTCNHCKERFIGDKRASSCADCAYEDWKPTHCSVKSDTLVKLINANVVTAGTGAVDLVIYEIENGGWQVMPKSDFFDGRFHIIN